jgi:hypothetical protein
MTTKKQTTEVFSTLWTSQHHRLEMTGSVMEIKLI